MIISFNSVDFIFPSLNTDITVVAIYSNNKIKTNHYTSST